MPVISRKTYRNKWVYVLPNTDQSLCNLNDNICEILLAEKKCISYGAYFGKGD